MLNNLSPVRNLKRLREVQAVLFRYGFDFLLDIQEIRNIQALLSKNLNIALSLPESEISKLSMPQRVRLLLQELGPTYVKLGQILSSRSDLLPREWIIELSKLQDEVPPFSYEEVEQIIEEELGPIEQIFLEFDPEPIASASIGQVHRATLNDLRPVMVKVQRPHIVSSVQSDMEFVHDFARLIRDRTDWGKKYGVMAIVDEMGRVLNEEMDYRFEATNADRLRRNMAPESKVHVPYMYWDYITARVLTMEAIDGVKINDVQAIEALGADRIELAKVFIHSIFKQLLIDGYFHADPHPGNLFVDKHTHKLVYLDMGMMGSLLPEQRDMLGDILQAILQRDTAEIARLAMTLGTPFQPVDVLKLRREMDRIIHQYMEAPLNRVSFSQLLSKVLTTIFANGIRLPAELGLAAKTFLQGEDIGHMLHPEIVIFDILKSVSTQVILKKLDPRAAFWSTTTTVREVGELLRTLPRSLTSIMKQIDTGKLTVGLDIINLHEVLTQLIIIANRLIAGLILAGMVIGSAIAMVVNPETTFVLKIFGLSIAVVPVLGTIGFIISMVIGVQMVWSVFSEVWRTQRKQKKEKRQTLV
jgi:ubiquinone biosynthesis protein